MVIRTDSKYVVLAFSSLDKWYKRKWRRTDGDGLLNVDLLKTCLDLSTQLEVIFNQDIYSDIDCR